MFPDVFHSSSSQVRRAFPVGAQFSMRGAFYTVKGELGAGGFGVIFAVEAEDGQELAAKVSRRPGRLIGRARACKKPPAAPRTPWESLEHPHRVVHKFALAEICFSYFEPSGVAPGSLR